jgi:hypothetical protein
MAGSPDKSWTDFRLQTFGEPYMVWHDGPDFTELQRRWATERSFVARMLRDGLQRHDPLAAQAIERLVRQGDGPDEIETALQSALSDAKGVFLVRAAEALFALTGDESYAEMVCRVVTRSRWPFDRMDAAIALRGFGPRAVVVQALHNGVRDRNYLVRRHSAQTLLDLAKRHTTIENEPSLWADIRSPRSRRAWR